MEYLSAWPPPESRPRLENSENLLTAPEESSFSATIASGSPPPLKRFKYELGCDRTVSFDSVSSRCSEKYSFEEEFVDLQQRLSPEELRIVECDYSVSADALLARWWKMMSTKSTGHMSGVGLAPAEEEERVMSMIKSNAGPQTQLYHISRYSASHKEWS